MSGQSAPFGEQLRRHREAAGLTQEELAERAGLTAHAIGALERGRRQRPYPHTVRALADALALADVERATLLAAVPRRGDGIADAAAGPPPARLEGRSHNLALQPTPLLGREEDIAAARQQLLAEGARLLTLAGPGGVGKTRLALAVADELRESYPHGAWFVDLAPLADPALVPAAIAHTLSVREAGARPLPAVLAAYLEERRLLLVLDNFEHLLPAATTVADLLASCPGLAVLVTSRERLRLRWERALTVPPLALPDLGRPLEVDALARVPAVALFVERARAVRPDFALTAENAAAVAALCARLDGLPLALELAAARASILAPAAILARLERRLPLLQRRAPDLPARHQALRAAIGWSYDLLPAEEQALFRRLGVFAGGWTLAAAEAVADAAALEIDALGGLAALAEKSLVYVAHHGDHADDGPRFAMLETIREYALEELGATGEAEATRRRHAAHYRALAAEAGQHLTGPAYVAWLGRLEGERHNLRAAMRALLDLGEPAEAVDLLWALWRHWRLSGQQGEARRWAEEALAAGAALSPLRRGRALLTIGMARFEARDPAALAALEEALQLFGQAGDRFGQALTLTYLGRLTLGEHAGARAQAWLEESERLFRALGEGWGASLALTNLGLLFLLRGDRDLAGRRLEEGLATARTTGDRVAMAHALHGLGLLARLQGDEDRAAERFAAALALAVEIQDRLNAGYFLQGLAAVAAGRGRPAEAARLLGAAEALLQATGAAPYRYRLEQPWHEQAVGTARAALGEAAFAQSWVAGRALSLEQAVAEAATLADELAAPPPARSAPSQPTGLSEREAEVLQLLAAGLSDKQIAARLAVSEHTARYHVTAIRNKLGADTRAQAVALAAQRGLL